MEKILLRQIATLQGHITEQVKVLNLCKEIGTSTFYDRDSLYIPHTKNSPSMFTPSLLRKKELLLETRSLLCTINQSFYSGNMPQMKTEIFCSHYYLRTYQESSPSMYLRSPHHPGTSSPNVMVFLVL